jgi:radical SAM superfamily enzyme YgiQ (UPF0313 family)
MDFPLLPIYDILLWMKYRPKILLINPWIYDFSAVNLWSRPLGLLKVAEYLSRYDLDLAMIDCTDTYEKKRKYGTGKYPRQIVQKPEVLRTVPRNFARYGISADEFKTALNRHMPFDLIIVTSIMTYWYPGVIEAIDIVRQLSHGMPVILGGIYGTLYPDHAMANSGADHVFRGHISEDIATIMSKSGITLDRGSAPEPYYNLGLYESYSFAPLITSSGCPYKCSYCASPLLFDGFKQREPMEVVREIKDLYRKGVRDFAFYDDALLVNADSHLKIILKQVIQSGLNIRFHCPNGMHVRFVDDELAGLMKESGFTTLRLSLETIDQNRQAKTGGKITTDNFVSVVGRLMNNGFEKEHVGVYLMYGLPGQDYGEVREGVDFLKSLGIRINLTEFSPIPGTSSWDELMSKGIIDDSIDPLVTNNSVFSLLFTDYGMEAIEELKHDVKEYNRAP